MGFEAPDIDLFLRLRAESAISHESCAILGDCHFYYGDSAEQFKSRCGFSAVDTFDINGDPTHTLDLQKPIPEEFHDKYINKL